MRWKGKITLLLIVFFAGFSTAIYALAPVEQGQWSQDDSLVETNILPGSILQSDQFARDFSIAMHKCLAFTENAAIKAGNYMTGKASSKEAEVQGDDPD